MIKVKKQKNKNTLFHMLTIKLAVLCECEYEWMFIFK